MLHLREHTKNPVFTNQNVMGYLIKKRKLKVQDAKRIRILPIKHGLLLQLYRREAIGKKSLDSENRQRSPTPSVFEFRFANTPI
eukprot:scaffold2109_cov188-Amphora_coffeaeformis.AAC.1